MAGKLVTKRRFPRRKFRKSIGFLLDGNYRMVNGEEVGEGGISLISPIETFEGKNLIVTFALEDNLHVMRGEVRNQVARPDGQFIVGIAFQNISFKYKKLIRRYIGAKTEDELINDKKEAAERLAASGHNKSILT